MDEDMINFLARCLLCAKPPNKHIPKPNTHVGIFSPSGVAQKLMDKIGMHLPSVQIEDGMPQQVCKTCIGKLNYCSMFENNSRTAKELLCKIKPKPAVKTVTIKTEPKDCEEETYCRRPEAVFIQESNNEPIIQDIKVEPMNDEVDIKIETDMLCPVTENSVAQFSAIQNSVTQNSVQEKIRKKLVDIPSTSQTSVLSKSLLELDLARCGICKLQFSRNSLSFHIKSKHRTLRLPEEPSIDLESYSARCDICDKVFLKKILWSHLKSKHNLGWIQKKGNILKCPLCPFEVTVQRILQHLYYFHSIQCKPTAVEPGMMSLEKLSAQFAPSTPVPETVVQKPAPRVAQQYRFKVKVRNESIKKPDDSRKQETEEDFTMVHCVICERYMAETSFWFHVKTMHDLAWLEKDGDVIKCPLCPMKLEENVILTHLESVHDIQIKPGFKSKSMSLKDLALRCAPQYQQQLKPGAPPPLIKCAHCEVFVENMPNKMECHLAIKHRGGKVLLCGICDTNFLHTGKEQPHMYRKVKIECTHGKCNRVFDTDEEMKYHIEYEHKKVTTHPIPVRIGNKVYTNKKTIRVDNNEVVCDICFKIIKNADTLVGHKNQVHGMNLKLYCDVCGRGFPDARTVRRHKHAVHLEKKPCPICGQLLNNGVFKKHVRLHDPKVQLKLAQKLQQTPRRQFVGYRPYDPVHCDICQTKCHNKYLMIKHINEKHLDVVIEPLEFWCEYCKKRYATSSTMVLHIMSRHVPKLTCAFCGVQRFRQRLVDHMRRCHKEIFRPAKKVVKKKSRIAQWVRE